MFLISKGRSLGARRLLAVFVALAATAAITPAVAADANPSLRGALLDDDVVLASLRAFPASTEVTISATIAGGSGTAKITTSSTGRALIGFQAPDDYRGVVDLKATAGSITKSTTVNIDTPTTQPVASAPTTVARPTTAAPAPTTPPAPPTTPAPAPLPSAQPADLRETVSKASSTQTVLLGAGTFTMSDFVDVGQMGVDFKTRSLTGAGSSQTRIEMKAKTSTKASGVPTADFQTNQLYVLSFRTGTPMVKGFTLTGGDQGHLYNGLRIGETVNARVSDVRVTSVPGNNYFPPGETFGINDWKTDGSVYDNITVDGSGIGAAGFGINSSKNIAIKNSKFINNFHSMGVTFWDTSGTMDLTDVDVTNNRTGVNFENDRGVSNLTRVKFGNRQGGTPADIVLASTKGSVKLTVTDPILPAGQKLKILAPANYEGQANQQLRSDIKVIVNGIDKTAEIVQFM